jgi:hypothetical protein
MTVTLNSNPIGTFPNIPRQEKIANQDLTMDATWLLAFTQLFETLKTVFKNEGILVPPLSATDINTVQSKYAAFIGKPLPPSTATPGYSLPNIAGQIVYDTTNSVPKIFIMTFDGASPPNVTAAAWKTFTIT